MKNIILQFDTWYLALCFLAGFIYAFVLYYKQKNLKNKSIYLIVLLSILRFVSISFISFLLLSPLYRYISEQKSKPIIVLGQDYSASLKNNYSQDELNNLNKKIKTIKTTLSDKYEIQEFSLGEDIYSGLKDSFILKSTNISKYIDYINKSFDSKELAGVILSSDGIFNEGTNPDYIDIKFDCPIYTIALGDTIDKKDVFVNNVYVNDIAFLGDQIGMKVDVQAKNSENEFVKLYLYEISNDGQKRLLDTKSIKILDDNFLASSIFKINANKAGLLHYRVSISNLKNEISYKNNTKDVFIEVIDSRVKILLLANSPHPDLGTIKDILGSNKTNEIDIKYKSDVFIVEAYDLVIFYNLPNEKFNIYDIQKKIKDKNISEFYIYGDQTNQKLFNQSQDLVKINGNSNSFNEVQALVNSDFKLFILKEFSDNGLENFPPMNVPFGEFELGIDSRVLLYQRINKINTKYPLLLTNTNTNSKKAVLLGSNIFKWRLFNYYQNENNDILRSLLSQVVQYLTVKKDKNKWRVNIPKKLYFDTENILFNAELYNENYELINNPEAYLKIINSDLKEYDFIFTRENNTYNLNVGMLPEGNYNYYARVSYNNKTYKRKGKFSIKSKDLEKFDLVAKHNVLYKLSSMTNGELYEINEIDKLVEMLKSKDVKPLIYYNQKTKKIIDFKWLFFMLLFLLSIEWFIRRYNGTF